MKKRRKLSVCVFFLIIIIDPRRVVTRLFKPFEVCKDKPVDREHICLIPSYCWTDGILAVFCSELINSIATKKVFDNNSTCQQAN